MCPWLSIYAALPCSNCTFMELKLYDGERCIYGVNGSNCTFMELKLQPAPFFFVRLIVLIVPLWN